MALIDELKERADRLDAEMLELSGRLKEIERESDAVHICINALDIAEMDDDADPVEALEQGRLAYHEGSPGNPYELGTPAGNAWHDGFTAEADEDRIEKEAIAALEAPAQPVHPEAELRDAPPAASEESGDQIGAPMERPWTLASAFYDGYKGRKHVAPQHPVYMEQWLAGDNTRNELTAEAVERAHAELDEIDAASLGQAGVEQEWTPTVQPAELTVADLDNLATKASPEERAEMERDWRGDYVPTADGGVEYSPEIPEGFTKWEGGTFDDFCAVQTVYVTTRVEAILRSGERIEALATDCIWERHDDFADIIAYRIIEAPASEHPASVETAQQSEVDRWIKFDDDTPEDERKAVSEGFLAQRAGVRRDSSHMREDLRFSWRYGYDIAADPTGIGPELGTPYGSEPEEPSPYAEAVSKGAITQDEADFLVSERERIAAAEQAKFFAEGMMADADRHQSDQRSIVEKIGGLFKREKEDA